MPIFPLVQQQAARSNTPPTPILLCCEEVNANTEFLPHHHDWGQVICVRYGVIEMKAKRQRLLAPQAFVVWMPPRQEHSTYNQKPSAYRTINISSAWCEGLPDKPCLLRVNTVFDAILDNCFERGMMVPKTEEELRLCRVMIDQLLIAPIQNSYLPTSKDKLLAPILTALEQNPGDNRSLSEWAKRVYSTERTLARRCQSELGLSFSQWRQRVRFLHALSLLERGMKVQDIALELGYNSASAFIVMFQQIAGTTPQRFLLENKNP